MKLYLVNLFKTKTSWKYELGKLSCLKLEKGVIFMAYNSLFNKHLYLYTYIIRIINTYKNISTF